jgi:hypothetical protein
MFALTVSAQGIDATPVTEDRIMYQVEARRRRAGPAYQQFRHGISDAFRDCQVAGEGCRRRAIPLGRSGPNAEFIPAPLARRSSLRVNTSGLCYLMPHLGCDQSSRSLANKRASQRSKPSAHILSHPPTTVRRSLERGKLALNLVTSAFRSSPAYTWHDLHSTTMIWPLRDLSVATSGNCGIRQSIACVLRPAKFVLVAHSCSFVARAFRTNYVEARAETTRVVDRLEVAPRLLSSKGGFLRH